MSKSSNTRITGFGIGSLVAGILSWNLNHAFWWCVLHVILGWWYVLYYLIVYGFTMNPTP